MLRFLLLAAGVSLASAQQYSIKTVAGGAALPTPAAAASSSIGQPRRVALDPAGNIYFSAGNSVYKMTTGGTLTLVAGNGRAGFAGDGALAVNAQLNTPNGLAFDKSGNLYIADTNNNRVRVVDGNGVINTIAGNGTISPGGGPGAYGDGGAATDASLHLPLGVSIGPEGALYIADTADNLIRKVTSDGAINSVAGNSYPGYTQDYVSPIGTELNKPSDVVVDSAGNFYIADTSNGRIRQVKPGSGVILTYAGTGSIGYSGDGGAATSANITAPVSLALDGSGNLFFVEQGDDRIRKVDSKGNISTVAGTGTAGFAGDGSDPAKAQFDTPTGVAVDGSGNLYVADSLNLRVRKIAGSTITTVAGNGDLSFAGDNGPASSALLNAPKGVAVDASGNLYIADTANNRVRQVSGSTIATVAGTGTAGFSGDGGSATSAQLNAPEGIAVDKAGNVYIADSMNNRVRMVSNGSITTIAGNGTPGFAGDGGSATGAQLNFPTGVAVDPAGNVYIADYLNNRIRKVSGGTITTIAGNGVGTFGGDSGQAVDASLDLPHSVAVDAGGNVYIADTANHRIRLVTADGRISTIAGNGQSGSSGDSGPAVSAQIGSPSGIAVDAGGNVFFTDGGTRVREVIGGAIITTIAGNGTSGYSGDGGSGANAQFNQPTGVALDAAGNVYVADTGNNAVRELQASPSGASIGAVANGASNLAGPVAPGEVLVLYGSGLGPNTLVQAQFGANGALPVSLAGTTVLINGAPAPMFYTSANQVSAIVPFEVTGTTARISVLYQSQTTAPVTANIVGAAPAIFTLNGSGTSRAVAVNFPDGALNGPDHPAAAGQTVILYMTGAGATNPPVQNGTVPTAPAPIVGSSSATVGGQPASVPFAGAAPGIIAGVVQVNLVVPDKTASGEVPVTVKIGGVASQDGVTIWVK